jgi:hypothetical protein
VEMISSDSEEPTFTHSATADVPMAAEPEHAQQSATAEDQPIPMPDTTSSATAEAPPTAAEPPSADSRWYAYGELSIPQHQKWWLYNQQQQEEQFRQQAGPTFKTAGTQTRPSSRPHFGTKSKAPSPAATAASPEPRPKRAPKASPSRASSRTSKPSATPSTTTPPTKTATVTGAADDEPQPKKMPRPDSRRPSASSRQRRARSSHRTDAAEWLRQVQEGMRQSAQYGTQSATADTKPTSTAPTATTPAERFTAHPHQLWTFTMDEIKSMFKYLTKINDHGAHYQASDVTWEHEDGRVRRRQEAPNPPTAEELGLHNTNIDLDQKFARMLELIPGADTKARPTWQEGRYADATR